MRDFGGMSCADQGGDPVVIGEEAVTGRSAAEAGRSAENEAAHPVIIAFEVLPVFFCVHANTIWIKTISFLCSSRPITDSA